MRILRTITLHITPLFLSNPSLYEQCNLNSFNKEFLTKMVEMPTEESGEVSAKFVKAQIWDTGMR